MTLSLSLSTYLFTFLKNGLFFSIMVTAPPPSTALPLGYTNPKPLAPTVKMAFQKRLHHPAEKHVPNAKYPQLEEQITLLQTVGNQPLSLREMTIASLAAGVVSLSWGLAKNTTLSFYKRATENNDTPNSFVETLIRKDVKDELGITKPLFYYTSAAYKQAPTSSAKHWKQWEVPPSEGSTQHYYQREEQLAPCNPWALAAKPNEKNPVSKPKENGVKQTFSGQRLVSHWQDECGVQWEAHHAKLLDQKSEETTVESLSAGTYRGIEVESNLLNLEVLTLSWKDSTDPTLTHYLRIAETEGIDYSLPPESSSTLKASSIIKGEKIKTVAELQNLLNDMPNLPASLKKLDETLQLTTNSAENKPSFKISLPERLGFLTNSWWGLQEKNHPLVLDWGQTLLHKAIPFLVPTVVGILGAGAGVLALHWWQEKQRNQTVLEALEKAQTPETITYAQAKRYQLLG